MKKIFYALLLLPILIISSCTNLSEINRQLDDHERRLKEFEQLMNKANDGINSLQQLIDAQAKRLAITSYEALSDGSGYVLNMSDGTKIVLKNGKDGVSPKVGVTEIDGKLYWTLNGEVILDASGNPIQAEGQNGQDGITPQIRVSRNGEWEISTDGGETWQKVLDTNGNPVKADGNSTNIDLSISENEDSVVIVYDGNTFVISKKAKIAVVGVELNHHTYTLQLNQSLALEAIVKPTDASNKSVTWSSNNEKVAQVSEDGVVTALAIGVATITAKTNDSGFTDNCVVTVKEKIIDREKLAIEYVAEYNINATGNGFATSHSNDGSGYFNFHKAIEKFAVDKEFKINNVGYHLPSLEEFRGIVPDYNSGQNITFEDENSVQDFSEEITIAGRTATYTADYLSLGNNNAYGIRFKGNGDTQRTAWRYQSASNPDSKGEMMLIITVRYLGPENTDVTVNQIADPVWWESNSSEDIVRYFPACGFLRYASDNFYENSGTHGYYWTSTEYNSGNVRSMDYSPVRAATAYYWNSKSYGFSVRLFSDK